MTGLTVKLSGIFFFWWEKPIQPNVHLSIFPRLGASVLVYLSFNSPLSAHSNITLHLHIAWNHAPTPWAPVPKQPVPKQSPESAFKKRHWKIRYWGGEQPPSLWFADTPKQAIVQWETNKVRQWHSGGGGSSNNSKGKKQAERWQDARHRSMSHHLK